MICAVLRVTSQGPDDGKDLIVVGLTRDDLLDMIKRIDKDPRTILEITKANAALSDLPVEIGIVTAENNDELISFMHKFEKV